MHTEITGDRMMASLYDLPQQFEYCMGMTFDFYRDYVQDYHNAVVSGLGGSAIGGDVLRTYAMKRALIPVIVNRDYNIPDYIDSKTLFMAVSYSGNTEETLSAYNQAKARGARIVCVTSGGKLERMAADDGFAVIKVPPGLMPRAAAGYLFPPLLLFMEKLGMVNGARREVEETHRILSGLRSSVHVDADVSRNPSRAIAAEIKDSIPIIWGTAGVSEVAALRWKTQINENAKCPAYYNVFPELNHNEIVGFEAPNDLLNKLSIIILRDKYDHVRVKKRIEISKHIIQDKVKNIIEVDSLGESFLARLYSLCYIGDYASVYLALEYGINPTPVEVIDYLKGELARE